MERDTTRLSPQPECGLVEREEDEVGFPYQL
jgi:hypothetical protein